MLLFGVLLTLTYQLQRRRYFYHGLGSSIGLEPDQPAVELIDGALNLFLIIIGLVATGLVTLAFVQIGYYCVKTPSEVVRSFLIFALFVLGLKFWSIVKATISYARFDRREGWRARWRRALVLIGEIELLAKDHADCDSQLKKTLKDLREICRQGGKDRWRTVHASLTDLVRGLRGTTLGNTVREQAEDLVVTLRHPRVMKEWKL